MVPVIIGAVILIVLMFSGMWIGSSMGFGSIIALWDQGVKNVLEIAAMQSWSSSRSFILISLPLFILMGQVLSQAGVIDQLFSGVQRVTRGKLPGGAFQTVLLSTIIFGACSGSSMASAASFASATFPVLTKQGYDEKLSLGVINAGGSLSTMIPPSITFVIIGMLAEVSISDLFMAGVGPGVFMGVAFMVYVAIRCIINPTLAPKFSGSDSAGKQRTVLKDVGLGILQIIPFIVLIGIVMGSIYTGLATPTEASAIGVLAAVLIAAIYRRVSLQSLWSSGVATVKTTAMMFFVVFGAKTLTVSMGFSGISSSIEAFVIGIGNPALILIFMVMLYVLLGFILDPMAIMLITIPFVFPAMTAAGFHPLFIGVLVCLFTEIGLLTPPVGFNLFVMASTTKTSVALNSKAALPFVIIMTLSVIAFAFIPSIILWLPSSMK